MSSIGLDSFCGLAFIMNKSEKYPFTMEHSNMDIEKEMEKGEQIRVGLKESTQMDRKTKIHEKKVKKFQQARQQKRRDQFKSANASRSLEDMFESFGIEEHLDEDLIGLFYSTLEVDEIELYHFCFTSTMKISKTDCDLVETLMASYVTSSDSKEQHRLLEQLFHISQRLIGKT